jgi:SAM-dependent methyltransferase
VSLVDEFHVGGRLATVEFGKRLAFGAGSHVLDIGSGLGGPSRYFALEHGCRVTGIDLTAEYVRVAAALSRRVCLDGRVGYCRASALALPFRDGSFDGAYMLHVGMNIRDKRALFAEVRRVLRPPARFGIYDVMRESGGELSHPLPWSASAEWSFVESPGEYLQWLADAGFAVEHECNRREFAAARMSKGQGLGLHLLMGEDAELKFANLADSISRRLIAPVEIICRAEIVR